MMHEYTYTKKKRVYKCLHTYSSLFDYVIPYVATKNESMFGSGDLMRKLMLQWAPAHNSAWSSLKYWDQAVAVPRRISRRS